MKKDLITHLDFSKLDIRVGEVKECLSVDGSKKLLKLQVDLGEEYGVVEILSGIAEWYAPKDLIGKKFGFLANLEPKKMMGKVSNGMILAADDDGRPVLLPLDHALKNGIVIR